MDDAGQSEVEDRRGRKAEMARRTICDAVITCLDRYGYAETTISRVTETAGVSRGALTHHFPTKEDLMVAATDRLLGRTARARLPSAREGHPSREDEGGDLEADFLWLWDRLANTKEGRVLLEILVAARTDRALRAKLGSRLGYWNGAMNDHFAGIYHLAEDAPPEIDFADLWTLARVFLRGLSTQGLFGAEPESQRRLVRLFARLMAPHLRRSHKS